MQAKDSCITSSRNNLEKRMARIRRVVPLVIFNLVTTQKTDRMISPRGPEGKLCSRREAFDHVRIYRFLKNNEVRCGRNDRLCQRLFSTTTAKTDVVAE